MTTKKQWVEPRLETLSVEKTLGGIVPMFSESIIFTSPAGDTVNGMS
ncbi:MAG: hypothetical protein AAGJ74_04345 [Pseudomonadota bacterium]